MLQIRAERGAELETAVETWGRTNVAMLSLTVRHGLGDDLREVRSGVTRAFQGLIRGNPWKRTCAKYGIEHYVRSIEVTHGKNGWHPHIHALLFFEVKPTDGEQEALSRWFHDRWVRYVREILGGDFVPNDEHAVDLRPPRRADYLSKLPFELTDPGTKRGRRGGRTPLEIGESAASGKRPEDEKLWVAYCKGMRGAKMLTWSRGLRDFVGLDDEKTDQEVVDGEEQREAEIVATIPSHVWDAVRDRRGLPCAILEAAELAVGPSDGHETIQGLVCEGRARPPPDDP